MSIELVVAMTTCKSSKHAERLACLLVEQRLAACVTIGNPTRSVYAWEGRIEIDEEVPLTIKTTSDRVETLKRAIEQHHSYSVPELLVQPVSDGLKPYMEWVRDWVQQDVE